MPISSQHASPLKAPLPKSNSCENNPLATAMEEAEMVLPTCPMMSVPLLSNNLNVNAPVALTGVPLLISCSS
jgi:hypothetical protein